MNLSVRRAAATVTASGPRSAASRADPPIRTLFSSALAASLLILAACSTEPATVNAQSGPSALPAIEAASPPIVAQAPEPAPAPPVAPVAEAESPPPPRPSASDRPAPDSGLSTARRCGWLHNPTPGNWWLFDGHGEWILASQGGDQARGMDDMPDVSAGEWTRTNGYYGYGCACMMVTARPGVLQVVAISSIVPKPLRQCRRDPALPRP